MIWELANGYRVRTEPMNFILERFHRTKPSKKHPEGRDVWKVVGYYSGLRSAISAIPSDIALSPEVETFGCLEARLDALADKLARSVGK